MHRNNSMKFGITRYLWLAAIMFTCSQSEDEVSKVTDLKLLMELPAELAENSGMISWQGLLWNINDGGNKASIYAVDPSDTGIQRTIAVKGATNTDWEDISQDNEHIFIGDFGNNLGDRQDLKIYILNKADVTSHSDSVPVSGIIAFSYEDQTDFTPAESFTTPWDCEAFIIAGDSIVVFTKNWQANTSSLYSLPARAGTYVARLRKKIDTHGLVTSAVYREDQHELLLTGYQSYIPFFMQVPDFDLTGMSFAGSKKTVFSDKVGTQTEGVAVTPSGDIYISCESSPLVHQSLFKLER